MLTAASISAAMCRLATRVFNPTRSLLHVFQCLKVQGEGDLKLVLVCQPHGKRFFLDRGRGNVWLISIIFYVDLLQSSCIIDKPFSISR